MEPLARKAGAWKSYAFVVDEKPGPAGAPPLEGQYQAGRPAYFKADGVEFYRKGDALAYRDAGRWRRARTGTLSDPLRILGASARVRRVAALPHEELAGLARDLTAVREAAGKGKGDTGYAGALTAAALRRWAPTEVRAVAREGSVRVWASGGDVVRYAVTLRLKGRLGDAEVDGTSTRTVELRSVGSTRVDVPAAARQALE
jgi:hypothetical protein